MLSIEQLTMVAYMTDGGILCRKCGEDERLPTKAALCAYAAGEYAGNEGLTCDTCGKEIIESYTWTCPACDTLYYGDEAEREEIGYDSSIGCNSEGCPGEED